jgi:hypothetical protein
MAILRPGLKCFSLLSAFKWCKPNPPGELAEEKDLKT